MRLAVERRDEWCEAKQQTEEKRRIDGFGDGTFKRRLQHRKGSERNLGSQYGSVSGCGGLTVAWCDNLMERASRRCVQCGEVIDPVILRNRLLQQTGTSGGVVMWSGKGTHA